MTKIYQPPVAPSNFSMTFIGGFYDIFDKVNMATVFASECKAKASVAFNAYKRGKLPPPSLTKVFKGNLP